MLQLEYKRQDKYKLRGQFCDIHSIIFKYHMESLLYTIYKCTRLLQTLSIQIFVELAEIEKISSR